MHTHVLDLQELIFEVDDTYTQLASIEYTRDAHIADATLSWAYALEALQTALEHMQRARRAMKRRTTAPPPTPAPTPAASP